MDTNDIKILRLIYSFNSGFIEKLKFSQSEIPIHMVNNILKITFIIIFLKYYLPHLRSFIKILQQKPFINGIKELNQLKKEILKNLTNENNTKLFIKVNF